MKRLGNVYERICDYANLLNAFGKVQRGKRERPDIQKWRAHLEKHLNGLIVQLQNGDYRFGDYFVFKVFDPKERTIHAAAVRERVIHHAVINICGEWLEKGLIDDSYACRRGKGQLAAVHRAQELSCRMPWCLKLDIKSYFDSIDQDILYGKLERRVKDVRLLGLFRALLSSYATAPGKGLPIGNLTSQYFANLYLDEFDRWAGGKGHRGYVRYMDDMLVFGEREELRELLREAAVFLWERLRLKIKNGGSLQPVTRGVDFLGYRVFPTHILLNQRSKRRFREKMKALDLEFSEGKCSQEEYQTRCRSLTAFVKHADTYDLRGRLLQVSLPNANISTLYRLCAGCDMKKLQREVMKLISWSARGLISSSKREISVSQ